MKAIAYAVLLIAGAFGGGAFAIFGSSGPSGYREGMMICVPVGLVIGGACAAFVAWLSKESK